MSEHSKRNSNKLTLADQTRQDKDKLEIHMMKIADTQDVLVHAMHSQATETKALNETINHLSNSLDNGVDVVKNLSSGAFKVARMIIVSYLFVLILLGCVIVYITNVDLNIREGTIKPHSRNSNKSNTSTRHTARSMLDPSTSIVTLEKK